MNLHKWMDDHAWRIEEEHETSEECKVLNSMDILDATGSSMYDINLKDFVLAQDYEKLIEWIMDEYEEKFNKFFSKAVESNQIVLKTVIDLFLEKYIDELDLKYFSDSFEDERCPDDYYPIWLTCWEFPTGYEAEELNKKNVSGLVFFDIQDYDGTFVSLTCCGMNMNPSLEYAYWRYSNINPSKEEIRHGILSSGVGYYRYVVGPTAADELIKWCGLTDKQRKKKKEIDKRFDKTLKKASDTDDQFLRGIIGLAALSKHQQDTSKIAKEEN